MELCAPYGQLVQTKLAVGPNRWRLVMHISLNWAPQLINLSGAAFRVLNKEAIYRNQAFVEFVHISAAVSMATRYADSSDPAKVRLNTVLPRASCLTGPYLCHQASTKPDNHSGKGQDGFPPVLLEAGDYQRAWQ